jgi:hypothetical protein
LLTPGSQDRVARLATTAAPKSMSSIPSSIVLMELFRFLSLQPGLAHGRGRTMIRQNLACRNHRTFLPKTSHEMQRTEPSRAAKSKP